jgi:hypothetical protein
LLVDRFGGDAVGGHQRTSWGTVPWGQR